jgi:hypothetical protein
MIAYPARECVVFNPLQRKEEGWKTVLSVDMKS